MVAIADENTDFVVLVKNWKILLGPNGSGPKYARNLGEFFLDSRIPKRNPGIRFLQNNKIKRLYGYKNRKQNDAGNHIETIKK